MVELWMWVYKSIKQIKDWDCKIYLTPIKTLKFKISKNTSLLNRQNLGDIYFFDFLLKII